MIRLKSFIILAIISMTSIAPVYAMKKTDVDKQAKVDRDKQFLQEQFTRKLQFSPDTIANALNKATHGEIRNLQDQHNRWKNAESSPSKKSKVKEQNQQNIKSIKKGIIEDLERIAQRPEQEPELQTSAASLEHETVQDTWSLWTFISQVASSIRQRVTDKISQFTPDFLVAEELYDSESTDDESFADNQIIIVQKNDTVIEQPNNQAIVLHKAQPRNNTSKLQLPIFYNFKDILPFIKATQAAFKKHYNLSAQSITSASRKLVKRELPSDDLYAEDVLLVTNGTNSHVIATITDEDGNVITELTEENIDNKNSNTSKKTDNHSVDTTIPVPVDTTSDNIPDIHSRTDALTDGTMIMFGTHTNNTPDNNPDATELRNFMAHTIKPFVIGALGLCGITVIGLKIYKNSSYYQSRLIEQWQDSVTNAVAMVEMEDAISLPAIEVAELTRLSEDEKEQLNQAHNALVAEFEKAQQTVAAARVADNRVDSNQTHAMQDLKHAYAYWDTTMNNCKNTVQQSASRFW